MIHLLTIFLGAFTLFFIQPLMGKALMPALGGGAAVWVTCLVFFQSLLLLGYLIAHGIIRLRPALQGRAWALLAAGAWLSVALTVHASGTPFLPPPAWTGGATETPVRTLLLTLTRSVGLPFLLLASASPLIQAWFARHRPDQSPFRLYALSNVGSFLGLLAFPFLTEPWLGTRQQAWLVSFLLAAFTAAMSLAAWWARKGEAGAPEQEGADQGRDPWGSWLLGSAAGALLLVAASNLIGARLTGTPMVWIIPLGLYLLSFTLVFEARWDLVRPLPFSLLSLGVTAGAILLMRREVYNHTPLALLAIGLAVLGGCSLCHGWIHSLRPSSTRLTRFYLILALGGALGGWAGALGAPLMFPDIHEFPLAVILSVICGLLWLRSHPGIHLRLGMVAVALVAGLFGTFRDLHQKGRAYRDFFGVVRVNEIQGVKVLLHGQTVHGMEVLQHPEWPLTYYGPRSGLGWAMGIVRQRKASMKIGLVGLGVGSAAAYARPGDMLSLYEISPIILKLAGPEAHAFSRVQRSGAQVRTILGDARATLEAERKEGGNQFDLLCVDAFQGGQIPWHLLTQEALELYLSHLSEDGILVVHATSDLAIDRLVASQARTLGIWALGIYHPSAENPGKTHLHETPSVHILLSRSPACADGNLFRVARWAILPPRPGVPVGPRGQTKGEIGVSLTQGMMTWTDDRNSLGRLMSAKRSWEVLGQ